MRNLLPLLIVALLASSAGADEKLWHLQPMDTWLPGECYRSPHASGGGVAQAPECLPKLKPFWLKKGDVVRWVGESGRWYLKDGDELKVEKVEQWGRLWYVGFRISGGLYCGFYSDELVKPGNVK